MLAIAVSITAHNLMTYTCFYSVARLSATVLLFVGSEALAALIHNYKRQITREQGCRLPRETWSNKYYSVVGIASDLQGTVKLLGAYLPSRFFKGTSFDKQRLQE